MLRDFKNNFDNIIVIHKKNYSDYTNNSVAGYHTFYHHIIEYEMFPKKISFIEYKKYLSIQDSLSQIDTLFVLFDLSLNEISKINNNNNFFEINTYIKK